MVEPERVETDGGMQSILSVHVARNRFGWKPRVSGVALVCLACLIRGSWCVVIRLLAIIFISYLTISDVPCCAVLFSALRVGSGQPMGQPSKHDA
jgi:hypothetical protein